MRKFLEKLANPAKSAEAAIVLVTLVSLAASRLNRGFGLVIGAIFAKERTRQMKVDYRLQVASAYPGFVVGHSAISGSIPLTTSSPDHFSEALLGIVPTSQTIFAP